MIKIKRWHIVVFFTFLISIFLACYKGDDKSDLFSKRFTETQLKKLQNDAQELAKTSNVAARGRVKTYFKLGDAYYYFKYYDFAINAYKKGLQLKSWDCEYQLKYAILQFEKGNLNDAYRGFLYVTENSKSKNHLMIAQKYLEHQKFKWMQKTEIELPDKKKYILYLTQFNEVTPSIIDAVSMRISQDFKISVRLLEDIIVPSEKNIRDHREELYDMIIEANRKILSDSEYEKTLSHLGIHNTDELSSDDKKRLARYFITRISGGEEAWKELTSESKGRQYDAGVLLDQVKVMYDKELKNEYVLGILAVTAEDIYARDASFLFGYARRKVGVISYARFMDNDTPSDITIKRTVIQSFSSLMFMFGLPRCTTPDCGRAYPHSLQEHDRKKGYLCQECIRNLKAKYDKLR